MLRKNMMLGLVLALGGTMIVGCGDDSSTPVDSGTGDAGDTGTDGDVDTGTMDTGTPAADVCAEPIAVTGTIGTVSANGDTSMVTTRPRDLGASCGNPEAVRFPNQQVVAYTVPGTEELGVSFSLANSGTNPNFASIVQVRSACDSVPTGDACFQDITVDEPRASGAVPAMGGDTLYFIVTGYAEVPDPLVDASSWQLDITAGPLSPPTLSGGQLSRNGNAVELTVSGMDDRGAEYYRIELQTADGMGIDLNEDGATDDADWVYGLFNEDLSTTMDFTGTDSIPQVERMMDDFQFIGDVIDDEAVVQAEVAVFDLFNTPSEPLTLTLGPALGIGEDCSTMSCALELMCMADACAASTEATTACGGATAITIDTPTDTTTTAMVSGSVPAGSGAIRPSCTVAEGPEVVYSLDVPAGSFDVIARTNLTGTGDTDTVVYFRGACADSTTELACNDDIDLAGGDYTSRVEYLEAPTGMLDIIVEQYAPEATDTAGAFAMEVSLRPIIETGDCDNNEVDDRCAFGACSGGTCPAAP